MNTLRRRLMLQESARWADAAVALTKTQGSSEAAYILQLLSFELLLKALVEQHTQTPAPRHHRYADIYNLLPDAVREDLLRIAGERIGPSGLTDGPDAILEHLGKNFSDLRYPWDRYADLSDDQYAALGPAWVAEGAPIDQAVFRYYPEELFGLAYAAKVLSGG